MAKFVDHYDLRKCKKQHLGPILLGRFLERGCLHLSLTEGEQRHFQRVLNARSATAVLEELFVSTAHGSELEYRDWNIERDATTLFIWDPERVKRIEARFG